MTKVLLPDGKPVGPVITAVKKAHDTDELLMHQKRMRDLFKEIISGYFHATKPPENQIHIVQADKVAAKKVATDRWEGAADTFNASSIAAKPVDRELMSKAIDEHEEDLRQQELHGKPISMLGDLTDFGFKLVGIVPSGELWISLSCAVCITDKGNCLIWMRDADDSDEMWCQDRWLPEPASAPLMRAPGYTLGSLKSLLQHVGIQRIIPPTERQMNACRVHRAPMIESTTDSTEPGWHWHAAMATVITLGLLAGSVLFIALKLWNA